MARTSPEHPRYTCNDYRQEMTLLALRRALEQCEPDSEEHQRLQAEIARLEEAMGL